MHHAAGRLLQAGRQAPRDRKCLFSFVATYRDIANAFPSISHAMLNRSAGEAAAEEVHVNLKARHEHMQVVIRTSQGESVVLAPKPGGAQGDKMTPVQFRRAYEGMLEGWFDAKQGTWAAGWKPLTPPRARP